MDKKTNWRQDETDRVIQFYKWYFSMSKKQNK